MLDQTNPDPAPGFPLRVGVVDMGSNAIRLLASEFIAPSTYTELYTERVPVRLGHTVYQTGHLDPKAMESAVKTMARFRDVIDELDITHHRCVATSAVRESDNGHELVRDIRVATDLTLEMITGVEEARLVYWAARDRIPFNNDLWFMVDLGGGSLEVALVNGSGMRRAESHTIGSVRLHEVFADNADKPKRFRNLVDEYLAGLRILGITDAPETAGLVATGGNMEDLAALTRSKPDAKGVSVVSIEDLEGVIAELAELTYEQRIEDLGLREDRADVILPAAMVYARMARLVSAAAIHVPFVGLKEGVMLDLVDGLVTRAGYTERHERDVLAGAVALGRRFSFGEEHGIHVARLAESLFNQLRAVHELSDEQREILLAAAVLHDIGQVISFKRHHKHSLYLISQSELPGFSSREIQLVANLARYHRRADPSSKHDHFAALGKRERRIVKRLAPILRLADALDREQRQSVSSVHAQVEDGRLILKLEGEGDFELERWDVERKSSLFEDVFGLQVVTEIASLEKSTPTAG